MVSSDRWGRLTLTLADAGIAASVTERAFTESVRGRVRRGVSRSIVLRAGDDLVVVSDTWWPKNPDVWTGWQVYREDRDGIVTRQWPTTKKRGQVRDQVLTALGRQQSDRPVDG